MSFLDHLAARVLDPEASLAPLRPAVFGRPAAPPADGVDAPTDPLASIAMIAEPSQGIASAQPASEAPRMPPRRDPAAAAVPAPPGPVQARDRSSAPPSQQLSAPAVIVRHETFRDDRAETSFSAPPPREAVPPTEPVRELAVAPPVARSAIQAVAPPPPAPHRSAGLLAQSVQAMPPPPRLAAPAPSVPAPVHITIGRIEVRAPAAGPALTRKAAAAPAPVLSLSDYLGTREAGR